MNRVIEINKMISEVREIPDVVMIFKNWWTYFSNISGLSNTETVCKLRNGAKFIIRPDSFDIRMVKEVYIHKSYHQLKLNKGDIVVDIGAHIGTFSVMAGREIGETGRVYAYEPVPTTFDVLKKNIHLNSLQNTIQPYKFGISNRDGKKEFYIFKKGDKPLFHSSSFYQEQSRVIDAALGEKIEVECITLKDIFELNDLDGINVLKVDCEGEEYGILLNTPDRYMKKIDRICMEYHDYLSTNYNHQDLINHLSKLGYDVFHETPENLEIGCGIIHACKTD